MCLTRIESFSYIPLYMMENLNPCSSRYKKIVCYLILKKNVLIPLEWKTLFVGRVSVDEKHGL